MNYAIVTDSSADFTEGYARENDIFELQLTYNMAGKQYLCNDPQMPPKSFYDNVRTGKMPKTSAVNPDDAMELLTLLLNKSRDVLCIMFSSALSGTFNNIRITAQQLQEGYPERKIIVIDSLCASAGQGLLVKRAVENRNLGMNIEDNAKKIKEDILHIGHIFTVNDLFHLHRGGRVSVASAMVGSMLGIKPVLHVDNYGRLVPIGKIRGRKQSLIALVNEMEKHIDRENCDRFAISHGDCDEDAQFVADEVCKRFKLQHYDISYVDPTVGVHSGPGTVALFFYAKER